MCMCACACVCVCVFFVSLPVRGFEGNGQPPILGYPYFETSPYVFSVFEAYLFQKRPDIRISRRSWQSW